jgi:serine/threonine protein kinase
VSFLSDAVVDRLRDVAVRPDLPSDRYVLHHVLGRGGMGTVYAATDLHLQREVAVKVSNAAAAGTDFDARLRREAFVLARLEHPGIVPVHDAGTLPDGRLYYVMKRVQGETLAARGQALRHERDALPVFERIVQTVAFAHAQGIVHRDLKPSNVMLGSFGEVLVLDWGVARVLAAQTVATNDVPTAAGGGASGDHAAPETGTATGVRVGTPGFMAPEQQQGHAATAGPPADVFALGALLFWMLTGRVPPPRREEAARVLGDVSPRPPKRLRAIVLRCLSTAPVSRYADAAALADDLHRYRAGAAVEAHQETLLDRLARWFQAYRVAVLLVAAYLIMRTLFAVLSR